MSKQASNTFNEWLTERLKDDEFRAEYTRLKPAYDVARLRMERGLTQAELARLVGTRQSSISRLESGKSEPSLSFLRRVVDALGGRLEITIVAEEEPVATKAERTSDLQRDHRPAATGPVHLGTFWERHTSSDERRCRNVKTLACWDVERRGGLPSSQGEATEAWDWATTGCWLLGCFAPTMPTGLVGTKAGSIYERTQKEVFATLAEMFAE